MPRDPNILTSYPIHCFPGCERAPYQAIAQADRPACAMVTALAALERGEVLGGALASVSREEARVALTAMLAGYGVHPSRVALWTRAVNLEKAGCAEIPTVIAGLQLDPYQVYSLGELSVAGGVLNFAVGIGKTISAVAGAIAAVKPGRAQPSRLWVACPKNATGTWVKVRDSMKRVFHEVHIVSVDNLHNAVGLSSVPGGVIIFDEAHKLGAPTTRRTKAAHEVRRAFEVGFCLTGTLLHGGVEKAMSVMDLAVPGLGLFSTRWTIGRQFNCIIKKRVGERMKASLVKPANKD